MIHEAKPCPFCGGEAFIWVRYGKGYFTYVQCAKCEASTKAFGYKSDFDKDGEVNTGDIGCQYAMHYWNRRNGEPFDVESAGEKE